MPATRARRSGTRRWSRVSIRQEKTLESDDANAHIALAEAYLNRAVTRIRQGAIGGRFTDALLADAHETAKKAEALGAGGWRLHSTLSVIAYYQDDMTAAYAHAEAAMKDVPTDPQDWNTMIVLGLFAEKRRDAIERAVNEKKDWPPSWLTDVNNAYALLGRHPHGSADQIIAHYDLLTRLGASEQATKALQNGLQRFPDSEGLHHKFRLRVLWEKGADALEAAYKKRREAPDATPKQVAFSGYASLCAAEFHRRERKRKKAEASYDRAIAFYEAFKATDPELLAEVSDHFIAVALAGKGRMALETGAYAEAVRNILGSFKRRERSANTLDGLNISAVDTAKMLRARLRRKKLPELAEQVDQALKALDPKLLELPAYEGAGPRRRN